MGVKVTTEPIDVDVNGVLFYMKGDPTNSTEWDTLMEATVFYSSEKREQSRKELIEAMAALAETEDDADTIRGLVDGVKTLKQVSMGYIGEVTGFPTVPPPSSTRRSKRTGGT